MQETDFIIRCLRCGTKNRIPPDRLGLKPRCGQCGARLDELIIRCMNCGTKNLIHEDRIHDRPICGKCGTLLYLAEAVTVSDNTFESEVKSFPGPVLVCCWAPWCVLCKSAMPTIDQLTVKYGGGVKIAKLNIDENPKTVSQYTITKTPTCLLFKHGQLVDTLTGAKTKEELEKQIHRILKEEKLSKIQDLKFEL